MRVPREADPLLVEVNLQLVPEPSLEANGGYFSGALGRAVRREVPAGERQERPGARALDAAERHAHREQHVRPLTESFFRWVREARVGATSRTLATCRSTHVVSSR